MQPVVAVIGCNAPAREARHLVRSARSRPQVAGNVMLDIVHEGEAGPLAHQDLRTVTWKTRCPC